MLKRVVQEAFGVALNPIMIRNTEFRELIQDLRKIIAHINNLTKERAQFSELQQATNTEKK